MKPINVGLLGIGTVGGGTYAVLERNAEEIARRAGRPIQITVVADRNVDAAGQSCAAAMVDHRDVTNDLGPTPLNIVIKMVRCNGQPVAKLSDSPARACVMIRAICPICGRYSSFSSRQTPVTSS